MSKYVHKLDPRSQLSFNEVYSEETFKPVDPVLQEVLERADQLNLPNIHVGSMPGLHIEVFVRMGNYKKAIEIGTLAGFSGICIARGLGKDGILHTVEFNTEYAKVAEESFQKAGLADNIKIHVGTALDVLKTLEPEGPFDVVFIDADKDNYPNYLKWCEKNVRVGGAVIGDNTFGWGLLGEKHFANPQTEACIKGILKFNETIANSPIWRSTILPTDQGLTVSVKIA